MALAKVVGTILITGIIAGACNESGDKVFPVDVLNDTLQTIDVRQCNDGSACGDVYRRKTLPPGGSFLVNVTSAGNVDWLRIFDSSGSTLGCIRLEFHERRPHLKVPVSERLPC